MSFLADKYAVYVIAAYAGTALIISGLIWSTLSASQRARRDLDRLEQDRRG